MGTIRLPYLFEGRKQRNEGLNLIIQLFYSFTLVLFTVSPSKEEPQLAGNVIRDLQ